jgi:hypothetical protein
MINMSDEWFVRVQDKEYGPVDLETLLEWKEEGRLIPANPVRREGEVEWVEAGTILALFPPALPPAAGSDLPIRRRTFGEIIGDTLRIYFKGFPQFLALALLVAIPLLGLKLSLSFVNSAPGEPLSQTARIAAVAAVVMLLALVAAWPIFLGGLQVATSELAAGRAIRLGDIFARAKSLWGRIAKLAMFVYGSFMFWLGLPLITMSALASSLSVISILLALLAFAFLVYMAVRLFTKFMFWQQSAALGELEGVEALRESDELARSRAEESLWQRPLYRGLLVLLLWVVVLIGISMAVELPFLIYRLRGVTDVEQAVAMMQALVRAPRPDALTITTYVVSSLVKALFRPLLGIAFVLLYLDARAGFRSRDAR